MSAFVVPTGLLYKPCSFRHLRAGLPLFAPSGLGSCSIEIAALPIVFYCERFYCVRASFDRPSGTLLSDFARPHR